MQHLANDKAAQQKIAIPLADKIVARVQIPGSKSLTNRALLVAGLARGASTLQGVLHSDDTQLMRAVLQQLGISTTSTRPCTVTVQGCDGQPGPTSQHLYVENAGTVARFMTPVLCLGSGSYQLYGSERMHLRPMRDLLQALRGNGCQITSSPADSLPLVIKATGLRGGEIKICGETSSQFLSALMMTAPYAQNDTTLVIEGELVSRPYIALTQKVMADFGAICHWLSPQTLRIPAGQHYRGCTYTVEADASSASYFFAAAAITGGQISVQGLGKDSEQGDLQFLTILEKMGCHISWGKNEVQLKGGPLRGCTVAMNTMSDVAPTLAIVGLFAEGKTTITKVANMRVKECDRIAAVCKELAKLGAEVEERADSFSVKKGGPLHGALIETYDDHRIAMAFAIAGLKIPGVVISNPSCVSKTFPGFFDLLLPLAQQEQPK